MNICMPNFFIGGATASGTSFLTALLLQHPDIYLPPLDKEPHFFSLNERYAKGINWYYQNWFSAAASQKAIGERSTTYFHFPIAAELLHKHFPQAKYIFVLRDPVERSFAQYRYMVLRGNEDLDFETALDKESQRNQKETRHFEYKGRSLYGQQLDHFLHFFSNEQILILSSKKLRDQTTQQLRRITDFLDIDPLESYKIPPLFSSFSVRDRSLQKKARDHFGSTFKNMIEGIRLGTKKGEIIVKNSEDKALLVAVRQNLCATKEEIPENLKNYLLNFFRQDQKLFFNIAGNTIDFNSW